MEAKPIEVQNYRTEDGREPFTEWLKSMRNLQARVKIEKRLRIVKLGNLGNYRSVGEGVCELKITYSPGYRVYFGFRGSTLIIILCGGDKSTQSEDIVNAIKYWKDYEKRESTDQ